MMQLCIESKIFCIPMPMQRLKHSAPAILPSSDLPAVVSQCAPEDDAIFTQRPWTDMLSDLDLNGKELYTFYFSCSNINFRVCTVVILYRYIVYSLFNSG